MSRRLPYGAARKDRAAIPRLKTAPNALAAAFTLAVHEEFRRPGGNLGDAGRKDASFLRERFGGLHLKEDWIVGAVQRATDGRAN